MDIEIRPLQRSRGRAYSRRTQQMLRAVQGIRYGSVEIIIHDSKVVQIEAKRRCRIDTDSSPTI